jgi:hypothetical protein
MRRKKMDKKEIKQHYKLRPPDMGVYQVKNLESGKIYLGRAMDLKGKLNSERFQLKNNLHRNQELQKDFNELGMGKFSFEVLDRLPLQEDPGHEYGVDLQILERMWLEKLQPYDGKGYNKKKS